MPVAKATSSQPALLGAHPRYRIVYPASALSQAELTLCKALGDAGAVKETNAQLAASAWICRLDS